MNRTSGYILVLYLLTWALSCKAQTSGVMAQKIYFKQSTVTVNDILKELIHTKKINLSFPADVFNVETSISLPTREITVEALLGLISLRTGNELIIRGNQVIIRKKKSFKSVLTKSKTPIVNRECDSFSVFIAREPVPVRLAPKIILQVEIYDGSKNEIPFLPGKEQHDPVSEPTLGEVNKSQTVSLKKTHKAVNSQGRFCFGTGGGVSLWSLSGLTNTEQNFRSLPSLGWDLRTFFKYSLNNNWEIESGISVNQSEFHMNTGNQVAIIIDSLRYDTLKYQNIDLSAKSLEIPMCLNYIHNLKKSKITIGLGGSVSYSFNGKWTGSNEIDKTSKEISWDAPEVSGASNNNLEYLHRINYYLKSQIGYRYKRWNIAVNVLKSINSFSRYNSGRLTKVSLTIYYQLQP